MCTLRSFFFKSIILLKVSTLSPKWYMWENNEHQLTDMTSLAGVEPGSHTVNCGDVYNNFTVLSLDQIMS